MADGPTGVAQTGDPYSAEQARKQWSELLNATQWEGKHVTITRGRRRAGILVPPEWYDHAVNALADQGRSPKNRA